MWKSRLSHCKSLDSLEKFVKDLDSEFVEFSGRSFVQIKTGDKIDLIKISNRVIDLYNQSTNQEKGSTVKSAEEAIAVLFMLKNLAKSHQTTDTAYQEAFGKSEKIHELSKVFKEVVRRDDASMSTIIQNYNQLARDYNSLLKKQDQSQKQDLFRLSFLNEFLGLKWSEAQAEGKAALPLCNETEIQHASPPKNLQPTNCKNLGELYGLMEQLRQEVTVNEEGKVIDVRGKVKIEVKEIEDALENLFNEALQEDPYIKTDVYLQAAAIHFHLNKLCHRNQNQISSKSQAINHACIEGLKNDSKALKKVKEQYNRIVLEVNDDIHKTTVRTGRPNLGREKTQLEQVEFLNIFVGFEITPDHFEGKCIFPVDFSVISDNRSLQHRFNEYAVLLNDEIEIIEVYNRIEDLQRQKDPNHLASLLITEEERAAINEELFILEARKEVLPSPLSKILVKSFLKEQIRLAEHLGVELNQDQKDRLLPLPLYGREIDLPKQEKRFEILKPRRIKKLEPLIHQFNGAFLKRERTLDYLEMQLKIEKGDLMKLWNEGDEIIPVLNDLKAKMEEFEYEYKGTFLGQFRWASMRLAELLLFLEPYDLVQLDDKQKNGQTLLPEIDINTLPLPDIAVMEKEIEMIDKDELPGVIASWPEHWKKEIHTQAINIQKSK